MSEHTSYSRMRCLLPMLGCLFYARRCCSWGSWPPSKQTQCRRRRPVVPSRPQYPGRRGNAGDRAGTRGGRPAGRDNAAPQRRRNTGRQPRVGPDLTGRRRARRLWSGVPWGTRPRGDRTLGGTTPAARRLRTAFRPTGGCGRRLCRGRARAAPLRRRDRRLRLPHRAPSVPTRPRVRRHGP